MKVKIEIDTMDIFDNTSSLEDAEIVKEMIDKLDDETIVDEAVKRGLSEDLFAQFSKEEQKNLIEQYAEDYGYVKKED